MGAVAYLLIVVGYGLFYTGLMDFSGNKVGLFQAFGYTPKNSAKFDSASFTYSNPVANMTSQPAMYTVNNGLSGSVQV
jgi:hypothetical protein